MPYPKAHAQANEPDRRPRHRTRAGRMRRSGPVHENAPFPPYKGAKRQSGTTGDSADPQEDPNARGEGRPRRRGLTRLDRDETGE